MSDLPAPRQQAGIPAPVGDHRPSPFGPPPGDDTIDLREVIALLRRHVRLITVITLAVTALAGYFAFTTPDQYRASATFRLKNEREALTGGLEQQAMEQVLGKTADPIFSQIEVLRSRGVVQEVVERTGLRLQPLTDGLPVSALRDIAVEGDAADTLVLHFARDDYTAATKGGRPVAARYGAPVQLPRVRLTVDAPPGPENAEVAVLTPVSATERVQEDLRARPIEKTDVVRVEYTAMDPQLAQNVVNTTVDVFQERSARGSQEASRRRRIFLEEQLVKTDSSLAAVQAALSDFRRREGVYSSREQFAAQQAGMLDVEMRTEELAAERRTYATLLAALKRGDADGRSLRALVSAPGIATNPIVTAQFQQLVRYRAARDSLVSGPWGSAATNPDVQRLDTLIASAEAGLVDAAEGHLAAVDARLRALGELRGRGAAEMQLQPDREAEEMRLVQRLETMSRLADKLREEYQKAQVAEAIDIGQVEVVDRAVLPIEPVGSGRGLKLTLGLMLGLMLGSGAAFLREHLNTRITHKAELEALLGVPGLAVIPRLGPAPRRTGPPLRLPVRLGGGNGAPPVQHPLGDLVTLTETRSAGAEAYRSLRTNLLFSQSIHKLHTVMVTSAIAAEGKTTTSANLAVAFAQQGLRVIIMDGDLRRARIHQVFGAAREPGLTDVLAEMTSLDDALRPTEVPGLLALTAGTIPPNPAELLGGERMRVLLDELKARADLVLIDGAPVLVAGDASIIGRMVDGVVLVVRAGLTDRNAALASIQQLRTVGTRVLGAVLNDPDARVPAYDAHSYYAYANYHDE